MLNDPKIIKVGVDPICDASKLEEHYGITLCGTLDLRALAKELNYLPNGLAKLAETHLNFTYKNKRITLSNWHTKKLSYQQIRYAALDAIVVFLLFQKFHLELKTKRG